MLQALLDASYISAAFRRLELMWPPIAYIFPFAAPAAKPPLGVGIAAIQLPGGVLREKILIHNFREDIPNVSSDLKHSVLEATDQKAQAAVAPRSASWCPFDASSPAPFKIG